MVYSTARPALDGLLVMDSIHDWLAQFLRAGGGH